MSNRGGSRAGAGAPKGSRNAAKADVTRKQKQWSAYPEDEEIVAWLIEQGYADNLTEVIRRAVREAKERIMEKL